MSDNLGSQEADRILSELKRQDDSRAWQIRKGEILKTEPPVFFEALADKLKDLVDGFNCKMEAEGFQPLSYKRYPEVAIVDKALGFTVQAMLQTQLHRVIVTTTTQRGIDGIEGKQYWAFSANETDGLLLNGKQPFGCAEALFAHIAKAYRVC